MPGPQPAFLAAAEHQRLQRRPLTIPAAHHQGANALGPVDLVRADADEIDARMAQRRQLPAEALRGVDVQVHVRTFERVGDRRHWLDDAGLVVDVHQADEERVRSNGGEDGIGTPPRRRDPEARA